MTDLILLGIIPAMLVVLTGMLIRRASGRRFLLYVLALSVGLLLAALVAGWMTTEQDSRPGFVVATLLAPATLGVLALVLLHLNEWRGLQRGEQALGLLLGFATVALLAATWGQRFGLTYMVLPGAVVLGGVWALGRAFRSLAAVMALCGLAFLGLCNALTTGVLLLPAEPPLLPPWLSLPAQMLALVFPGFVVASAAVMLATGLKQLPKSGDPGVVPRRFAIWRLALAAGLLSYLAYTIIWASIWDQTSDGLGGLFLVIVTGVTAVGAGMVIAVALSGWRRLVGLVFAALVPLAVIGAFNYGWDVSYHALTEARAARIQAALERFHARMGGYPTDLRELVPRELWWIPGPVILQGQGWCYQGGPDFYRLGAIYREYFSTPLSVRIYASAGSPPETGWACEALLAELKPRYDPPPMAGGPAAAPTQAPLPTSVVAVPRSAVQPLIRSASISVGDWSPDGRFLVFGLQAISNDQSVISLDFLNAQTGEICPASDTKWATAWGTDGLREHYAWLRDGRLLFASDSGDLMVFKPCEARAENLAGRYPVTFTQVLVSDKLNGRVLLKNAASYWILDSASLAVQPIAQVSPNPLELHWDSYAWSPGGDRLAIARLNGRAAKEGSTLYVVDGATGRLERSLPRADATDQRAPMIEWLTTDDLLIHGSALTILDLRSDPPKLTDVLRDIFLLDIAYPDDVSAMAWEGQHLAVRVNRPRNQGIYIYHLETGQVEVLQSEVDALLFFPDGEAVDLSRSDQPPAYRDEYDLFWVDTPARPRRLVVEGHVPRSYPQLFPTYLPATSQLAFSSSQGVSLVSVPDGKLIGFWELAGGGGYSSHVLAPPRGEALVVVAEEDGLYDIRLADK